MHACWFCHCHCHLSQQHQKCPCASTQIEQLHKIFKLCGSPSEDYWAKAKLPDVTLFKPQRPYRRKIAETFRDFPPTALALLDTLLAIEPSARGTAASALDSEVSKQLSSLFSLFLD